MKLNLDHDVSGYFVYLVLALFLYMGFQVYRVYVLKRNLRFQKKKKGLFVTQIYNLLINGVRTTEGKLSVDRRPYPGNNVEVFAKDVLGKVVNMIIISGHPYDISYHSQDDRFYHFHIKNRCSTFPLPACTAGLDAETLITKFVHVLGFLV